MKWELTAYNGGPPMVENDIAVRRKHPENIAEQDAISMGWCSGWKILRTFESKEKAIKYAKELYKMGGTSLTVNDK